MSSSSRLGPSPDAFARGCRIGRDDLADQSLITRAGVVDAAAVAPPPWCGLSGPGESMSECQRGNVSAGVDVQPGAQDLLARLCPRSETTGRARPAAP